MKNIYIYISIILFSFSTNMYSQILFEDFDINTCNDPQGSCESIRSINNDNCLPNWFKSHGSPNLLGDQNEGSFEGVENIDIAGDCITMIGICEGIFTRYNFRKNVCYEIKFDLARLSGDNTSTAVYNVVATNDLVGAPISCCSDPPMSNDNELIQAVQINPIGLNNWVTQTIVYTPSDDFLQIQFFPNAHTMLMDNLEIKPLTSSCELSIEFLNTGLDIPAGLHQAEQFVRTASVFTPSGIVNSAENDNTMLKAGDYIQFEPNTHIEVIAGHSFSAKIEECPAHEDCEGINRSRNTVSFIPELLDEYTPSQRSISQHTQNFSVSEKNKNKYSSHTLHDLANSVLKTTVFPNPFKEKVTIQFKSEKKDKINIQIFDSYGKLVETIVSNHLVYKGLYSFTWMPKEQPNGIYFYTITTENTNRQGKIIFQK